MLNTLFPQLCELNGASHVRLLNQFGSILQSTKKWPESVEDQRSEWATCCSIAEQLDLGQLFEVWMEGRRLTLVDHFDSDLFVYLSGKNGKKGVWKYELERLRREWNAQQTKVI